jgi:alkylated DNA repair protein alkB family protein 6
MPMASLTATCLEHYTIQGLPSSAFYISEFISKAEEQALLDKVCNITFSAETPS